MYRFINRVIRVVYSVVFTKCLRLRFRRCSRSCRRFLARCRRQLSRCRLCCFRRWWFHRRRCCARRQVGRLGSKTTGKIGKLASRLTLSSYAIPASTKHTPASRTVPSDSQQLASALYQVRYPSALAQQLGSRIGMMTSRR